jgi:signal transduction histidine kinase
MINKVIQETFALTDIQILKDSISLEVNVPESLPPIYANSQQLMQVFINIINNARYALNQKYPGASPEKKLIITAEPKQVDNDSVIDISFHDTGVGIPAQIIDKVINPFFTTKPAGEGTGLGLAISHGIVTDHDGRLIIKSVEGEFTRVTTRFPLPESDNSSETV